MGSHRCWMSLVLIAALSAGVNVAAQTPDTLPPLPTHSEHPFWTKRRVYIFGGFGAAAAAGVAAWRGDQDLRARKRELLSLPAGSNDEWAARFAEAERVLKNRNFWGAVAAGVGSVTLIYMFTSRSHAVRPLPGGAAFVWAF